MTDEKLNEIEARAGEPRRRTTLSKPIENGACGRDGCVPGWPCVECVPVPNGLGTPAQLEVLRSADRLARHDMVLVPRAGREEAAKACARAGWLSPVACVLSDGDGYALVPETWTIGYDLTDAGRAALARTTDTGGDAP